MELLGMVASVLGRWGMTITLATWAELLGT